jgi:hypothetical protein
MEHGALEDLFPAQYLQSLETAAAIIQKQIILTVDALVSQSSCNSTATFFFL